MNVFFADEQDDPLEPGPLVNMAEWVLAAEGAPAGTEVSLVLVNEESITQYNERFMGRDGPTDVLAFPLEDLQPGHVPSRSPHEPPLVLGDVFICPTVVRRQAAELEVSLDDELALIVTHGVLHLLGYDHTLEEEAEQMGVRDQPIPAEVRSP